MAESDETGTTQPSASSGRDDAPHRIGGRYEIGELLGRGGMAEVRKGTDVRLGRTVAVKRLRTDLASDATFQARFRREAQSAASLNHPAIVSVYDTGEEVITEGGHVVAQPYIVMEHVAGRTLRDILREGRKILPERALEITSQVLAALDYSHRAGIVHRDIKPANVMLTPSGDVKVMDFGIARAISDASSTMTQTAAVVGTAQYLSPEQARGETVDSRSDVYSTGCLLYELLTGRPPFVGDSPVAVAYQHVRELAPPPSSFDEDLTPGIDAIVMKALAKPTAERYQSAAEMKADIDRYLDGKPVVAPPVAAAAAAATQVLGAGPAQTSVVPAVAGTGSQPAYQEPRRNKAWPLIVLALLLAALVAAAAILGPRLLDSGAKQVSVPSLVNAPQDRAEQLIRDAGLVVGDVEQVNSEEVPQGRVVSQEPPAGQQIAEGSEVDFQVSAGPEARVVPYVIGDPKESARDQIEERGLRVRFEEVDSDEDKDVVVATDPEPGTEVGKGTVITVQVSRGPVEVPDVVGKTQAEAEKALRDAGFEVEVREEDDTTEPKGQVVDQTPDAGATPGADSTVTIFVSTYEEPEPEPSPTPTVPSPTVTTPPAGQQTEESDGSLLGM